MFASLFSLLVYVNLVSTDSKKGNPVTYIVTAVM